MTETKHIHKFDQRVKRKVPLIQYGATVQNPHPGGMTVGHDYILMWKCSGCPAVQPYDLEREVA